MEKKNPVDEAMRYVENAKEVIKKANYDTSLKLYTDGKYVKMAGNTLWNGCLIALDAVLKVKEGKGRPSIDKYKDAAGKRDKKLLSLIIAGYDVMHLTMGYDGCKNKKVCDAGFQSAIEIISRCKTLYQA